MGSKRSGRRHEIHPKRINQKLNHHGSRKIKVGCIKMKNYTKRINIWIDEDFENQIKNIKSFIKYSNGENCGYVSTSDAIRFVVKKFSEKLTEMSIEKNKDI